MQIINSLTSILLENPILVLFLVVAVGYLVGKIRIGSFSLGVVAVLFAGLGISAFNAKLALPPLIYTLGLVLFVYTIGIASGPSFFAAFRKKGLRNNLFAFSVLLLGGVATVAGAMLFHVKGGLAAGMYTGAFTNTPALASVLDTLGKTATAPVVGYSLAYPLGVLCVLAVLAVFQKLWKIDEKKAGETRKDLELYARTVRVTRKKSCRVDQIASACSANISVSRLSVDNKTKLAKYSDVLKSGTLVTIVGNNEELDKATAWLGVIVEGGMLLGEDTIRNRRVFISDRKAAGRTLESLNLLEKLGVIVTRIRRGDIDFIATPKTVLELGDRVKIVGPDKNVQKATKFFGDSYHAASEMDVLTFAVGIGIGILIGLIPVPLPGGTIFHLGAAGGTLLAGLILGARGRTGKVVWQMPFSTNMTLRQIGLVLFLAGIGTQAGGALAKALSNPASLTILGIGAALTTLVSVVTLVVGYKLFRIPFAFLSGLLASIQTQPAVLAFANERTSTDEANIGYASVYPVAMIAKIVIAQILIILLI